MSWKRLADITKYEIFDKPLWFHEQGLSQTASGYGKALTSSRMVRLPNGREYRVYVTCYSNSGTSWIKMKGEQYIVD